MADVLYIGLQDDDKIAVFALDGDNGQLTKRADVAAAGGPSVMAISPDRNTLYVGCRTRPSIASYRIDPATGGLSLLGTAAQADAPTLRLPTAMTRSRQSFSGNIGSAAPRSWAASASKATTPPAASDAIVAISPEFPTSTSAPAPNIINAEPR